MLCDEDLKKNIGIKLKTYRKTRGLTQNQVAEAVDMDEKQLSRLEAGKHYPTLKTLFALIKVLNMRLSDFDVSEKIYDKNFYTIVSLLETSTSDELKKYLKILKVLKEID